MLSADVATQRLRAAEQLVALGAPERVVRLNWSFNQIEVAFDLYSSVSSLWGGHVWGWGLCHWVMVAVFVLQLQGDLAFNVFRILAAALVVALFSHGVLLIRDPIFEPPVLLLEEWPEAKSVSDLMVGSSDCLITLAICRSLLSPLQSVYLACIRSVPHRELGAGLIWCLGFDACLWGRAQPTIILPHHKWLYLSVVVPEQVDQ